MNQNQKQVLQDLAQSTAQHLEQFGQTLQSALVSAPERLEQIKDTVGPALDKLHETMKGVEKHVEKHAEQGREGVERAGQWVETAQRKGRAVQAVLCNEPTPDHSGEKVMLLLIGVGAGALVGLLLAPTSGRRSRAIVRDQFQKNRQHLAKATSSKAADLSNKARGISHKIQEKIQPTASEDATDVILADRIRTRLGQQENLGLPHLNIDCNNGTVTLHGPTVNAAQEIAIITAIKSVEGVIDVVSKLPVSCE